MAFDVNTIDPGVRALVCWLRDWRFDTTDSGDGVSKPENERAIDGPHVFMTVPPSLMAHEALRLLTLVRQAFRGVPLGAPNGIRIEASYSPIDDTAVLMLLGATDTMFSQHKGGA